MQVYTPLQRHLFNQLVRGALNPTIRDHDQAEWSSMLVKSKAYVAGCMEACSRVRHQPQYREIDGGTTGHSFASVFSLYYWRVVALVWVLSATDELNLEVFINQSVYIYSNQNVDTNTTLYN